MSATSTTAATTHVLSPPAVEAGRRAPIPLSRLVSVELRKLGDTRAGRWLLIAIGVITLAAIVIFFLASKEADRTFVNFALVTTAPQSFLLPVLGILLVTSEWSQRTALVSFTLVPVRGRVIAAKVIAALIAALAAVAATAALAALATLVAGTHGAWDGVGLTFAGNVVIAQVSGVLQGLAYGLLLLSSAAAIVSYFVLPTAFSIVAGLWKALADVRPWIDLSVAQQPLIAPDALNGHQWAQLGTGTLIWIVLPFVAGLVRVLRAEVK